MPESRWNHVLYRKSTLFWVLLVAGLAVSVQAYITQSHNNYFIFKYSFLHLIHWQNLYVGYPAEHRDLYLYSPTFALLMAPFAYLPNWLGVSLWILWNCAAMYFAINLFPKYDNRKKVVLLAIILIECITSIQNQQTNPLIAAGIVLAFVCFERKKVFWAAFFIMYAGFIKVFGLAAAALFLMYPNKGKFMASMVFWGAVFVLAPLVVVPYSQLVLQYQNWFHQLAAVQASENTSHPHSTFPPLSVMGWLKTWFQWNIPVMYVQLIGVVLLFAPLLKTRFYKLLSFRYLFLASLLVFCVIFNHIAESPSYVIAVFGVAIWFTQEKKNGWIWFLLGLCLVFTILSPTDIFPRPIRTHYVIPYVLKAVPCILIWCWLQYRIWSMKKGEVPA